MNCGRNIFKASILKEAENFQRKIADNAMHFNRVLFKTKFNTKFSNLKSIVFELNTLYYKIIKY